MSKVIVDITMSLDGFICGPDDDLERIHAWLFSGANDQDKAIMDEYLQSLGAVIMGRGTFDDGVKKQGWSGWVDTPPFQVPMFVLLHTLPEKLSVDNPAFTFVMDGIERALAQAKAVAKGKDVNMMGGANTVQQYLQAGLIDEIQIHLVPLMLGEGKRLFEHNILPVELEQIRVVASPQLTHHKYRVLK
jgi:dihydrofolate reductase